MEEFDEAKLEDLKRLISLYEKKTKGQPKRTAAPEPQSELISNEKTQKLFNYIKD